MTHHHDNANEEISENNHSGLLSGPKILPHRVRPDMTVAELVDEQFQAYNGARLNEAARLYAERMLDPELDVTIGLTMAGALTPAGLGGCILTLMEYGFIDFIISTGANLYHDMHHALAMSLHRGDFQLDDIKLQEEGIIRIYDILFDDKVLLDTDVFVRESLHSLPNRPISTSELHNHLGKQLLKAGVKPEYSILAQAAAWNVPLYTSSPGDSSIGMNVARHALDGNALTLDPLADVNETTAIVHHATRNGVIILGGGSPKTSTCRHNHNCGRYWAFKKVDMITLFKSPLMLHIGVVCLEQHHQRQFRGGKSSRHNSRTLSSFMVIQLSLYLCLPPTQ